MEFNLIKEVSLYVKSIEVAETFYAGVLGFEVIARKSSRHIFFRTGRTVLLCFIADTTQTDTSLPPHGATGSVHIAFEVEAQDYEQRKLAVQEMGIEIIHEQSWHKGLKSFYFNDPDGNLLEVVPSGLWE